MDSGNLTIHYLNVGHGDCTVIEHPSGRITVIDTTNGEAIDRDRVEAKLRAMRKDARVFNLLRARGLSAKAALKEMDVSVELTNPLEFLERMYPDKPIFRYIQTHPEMDHMRGLDALLRDRDVKTFWDTENDRDGGDMRNSDLADWEAYRSMRDDDRRRPFVRGYDWDYFGSAATNDKIDILSPTAWWTRQCDQDEDWNNMSVVIRVMHNGRSFVFGGDAEPAAWEHMMADPAVKAKLKDVTVLKASHHGRLSGYDEPAVTWMSPDCVVMSIGKDCDHEAIEDYENHTDLVLSTYDCGDITMTVDETGKVTYETSLVPA